MGYRAVNRLGWGTRDTDLDEKVRITTNDTTSKFLNPSIVAGAGIITTVINPGANEQLQIAASGVPSLEPQWIGAGAFAKRSGDAMLFASLQFTSAPNDDVYDIWPFPDTGSQKIYFTVMPPKNWTSTRVKFTPHFIIDNPISLPGTIRFTLALDDRSDALSIPTAKTSANSDKIFSGTTQPAYYIGPTSPEIIIAGATDSRALIMELTRDTAVANNESQEANFLGFYLEYI